MLRENKKVIVVSLITALLIIILIFLLLVDIPVFNTLSIKGIMNKRDELILKEAELVKEQTSYQTLKTNLENLKTTYEKEKTKYEAISDETVNIITESNTEENYSLEYMWIKLGNYATKNNLTLVMVEPGNSNTTNNSTQGTTDESVVEGTSTTTATTSSNSGVLQIQVTGSYIDLSDFIFEVENDTELRFKLDNISMELVSGTTIKTTFDVKNIIINK